MATTDITSIPTLMVIREGVVLYSRPGALPESQLADLVAKVREVDMDKVRAQVAPPANAQAPEISD